MSQWSLTYTAIDAVECGRQAIVDRVKAAIASCGLTVNTAICDVRDDFARDATTVDIFVNSKAWTG